ncbi:MAG: cell wall hydrolase [Oscillospiraceae bacterium]|nr:cell wall hydrolase [Oscillospiraceae bacterium]
MLDLRKILCTALAAVSVLQVAAMPASASEVLLETTPAIQIETIPAETTAVLETEVQQTIPEQETVPEETQPEEAPVKKTYDKVPLYFQTDYPDTMYGNGTVATSGCSITSLAMVATYLTDHEYLPDQLARYFGGEGVNNIDRLEIGARAMKLFFLKPENWHRTLAEIKKGKVAVILMNSKSIFTDTQHFIVVTGINEEGKLMVNDSYAPNYDRWDLKNAFANGFSEGDILRGYEGAWVFDKKDMPAEPFLYFEEELDKSNPRYPEIQLTPEEKRLLAKVVWVEAQGECADGQQAVAEVVLNRLHSEKFSNTLNGVIYAEGQFRSVPFLDDAKPSQAQYEAIERALYGPYILPEEVFYFATYPSTVDVWGEIGGHIFCY